jgi:hypothetical protein
MARVIVSPEDIDRLKAYRWHVNRDGYVRRYQDRRTIFLHREIMEAQPGQEVHHINHNPLDNRRENLRVLSHGEHARIHSRPRRRNIDPL